MAELTTQNVWNWNRMLCMADYYKLALAGWPGWDKPNGSEPPMTGLSHKAGVGKSSRELAIEFDDIAEGKFYYRDFTDSGIPIVSDGEVYRSQFTFQYASDFEKFNKLISDKTG